MVGLLFWLVGWVFESGCFGVLRDFLESAVPCFLGSVVGDWDCFSRRLARSFSPGRSVLPSAVLGLRFWALKVVWGAEEVVSLR